MLFGQNKVKTLLFDKRRRYQLPYTLVTIGVFFLLLPFINLAFAWYWDRIPLKQIFSTYSYIGLFLLIVPVFIGIGLLRLKKWGWYFFLVYAFTLTLYNIYVVFYHMEFLNIFALVQTIFGMIGIYFFLRKDISAPYMSIDMRGWRSKNRHIINSKASINEKKYDIKNISVQGIFIDWSDCNLNPGDEIEITFPLHEKKYCLQGGIARIEEGGVA